MYVAMTRGVPDETPGGNGGSELKAVSSRTEEVCAFSIGCWRTGEDARWFSAYRCEQGICSLHKQTTIVVLLTALLDVTRQ